MRHTQQRLNTFGVFKGLLAARNMFSQGRDDKLDEAKRKKSREQNRSDPHAMHPMGREPRLEHVPGFAQQ